MARGLARHYIFDARPPGARRDGEIVMVSQEYVLPGADERVLGFYRDAATRAGWRRGTEGEDWICLTRVIAGRDVALSVIVGKPPGTYAVSLNASVNNGGGCYEEFTTG